jgi:hypothetical protein
MNEKELYSIRDKNKSVKVLIDKIKWHKPSSITYETLRITLKGLGYDTNETELKNILYKVKK